MTTMLQLQSNELDSFLQRFNGFHDAVLAELHLVQYEGTGRMQNGPYGGPIVTITLPAIEGEFARASWTRVTLMMSEVECFVWREAWQDLRNLVVYGSAFLGYLDGFFYFAIGPSNGDLYNSREAIVKDSAMVIAGRELFYRTDPVQG